MNIIELDAASNNSVDDIRALNEQVMMPPTTGTYRVFIIDEVHMLSTQAFNAFLKTLEEPPSYVIFILATTEKHKIIPTILSRCQIHDFNRITIQDMVNHLSYVAQQEGITAEPAALNVIAQKADGAMRDALSIFDQVAASSLGNITYASAIENLNVLDHSYYSRLLDAFLTTDVPAALLIYQEVREKGFDSQFFINGLGLYLRDIMVARDPKTLGLLEATDDIKQSMAQLAQRCTPEFLYKAMSLCNDADFNYRQATNKQFLIELTLIKLCQLLSPSPLDSGTGEGQLKKIVVPEKYRELQSSPATTPTAAPAAPQSAPQQPVAPQAPAPAAPQPIAQPTQQPVATQTYQPTTPPPARPRFGSIKAPHLSLKTGLQHAEQQITEQHTVQQQHRTNKYSDAMLETTWNNFINANPKAHLLITSMRAVTPTRIEGDRFGLAVVSTIQLDALVQGLGSITQYVHDKLGNDNITFEPYVKEGAPSPNVWNEREVLAHMIETAPELKKFIQDFKLSL
jgi:DNA polymerase-3 subunit gamma/tau